MKLLKNSLNELENINFSSLSEFRHEQNSAGTLNELWKDKEMKELLNKNKSKEERNCLFIKNTNCSILKTKDCSKCKFYVENTPENYKKYKENIKVAIKNYTLKHN